MKKGKLKLVTFKLDEETHTATKERASDLNITMSEYFRRLIAADLDTEVGVKQWGAHLKGSANYRIKGTDDDQD